MAVDELRPSPENPRRMSEDAMRALGASLERFGYVEPIVWNERTGHIVGGNQRCSVLRSRGVREAYVVAVDMSEEDELAANLTLNNPEVEGEWDDPILDLLAQIEDEDRELFDLMDFGALRDAVENMAPRRGEDSYEDKNREIDIDDLTKDCDTKCPHCGFEWELDERDVHVVREDDDGQS